MRVPVLPKDFARGTHRDALFYLGVAVGMRIDAEPALASAADLDLPKADEQPHAGVRLASGRTNYKENWCKVHKPDHAAMASS